MQIKPPPDSRYKNKHNFGFENDLNELLDALERSWRALQHRLDNQIFLKKFKNFYKYFRLKALVLYCISYLGVEN
jgi:hypothetical protein